MSFLPILCYNIKANTALEVFMKKENKALAKKAKAEAQKKAARKDRLKTILLIGIPALIIIAVFLTTVIDFKALFNGTLNTSKFFSKYLTEEGYIENVDINDYVTIGDYTNFTIAHADIAADEDEIQERIQKELDEEREMLKVKAITVAEGDTINIDFDGTVDGVPFEGGSSNDGGYELTLGSGKMIPGFEEAIVGHNVGETFMIDVTFPDDYSEELGGKAAVFEIKINGIYQAPELTDEFVQEHLNAYADTAEEYRAHVRETIEKENIIAYVKNDITESNTVNSYPSGYFEHLEKLTNFVLESEFDYYVQYYGDNGYDEVHDYYNMTEEEYAEYVSEKAKLDGDYYMIVEAIYRQLGLSLTETEVTNFWQSQGILDGYEALIDVYGVPYATRMAMAETVIDYLAENAVIAE